MDLRVRLLDKELRRQFSNSIQTFSVFGLTLGDWQIEGIRWMLKREQDSFCRGGFLFDDMGLGKTIQTIGLIR